MVADFESSLHCQRHLIRLRFGILARWLSNFERCQITSWFVANATRTDAVRLFREFPSTDQQLPPNRYYAENRKCWFTVFELELKIAFLTRIDGFFDIFKNTLSNRRRIWVSAAFSASFAHSARGKMHCMYLNEKNYFKYSKSKIIWIEKYLPLQTSAGHCIWIIWWYFE